MTSWSSNSSPEVYNTLMDFIHGYSSITIDLNGIINSRIINHIVIHYSFGLVYIWPILSNFLSFYGVTLGLFLTFSFFILFFLAVAIMTENVLNSATLTNQYIVFSLPNTQNRTTWLLDWFNFYQKKNKKNKKWYERFFSCLIILNCSIQPSNVLKVLSMKLSLFHSGCKKFPNMGTDQANKIN